MLTGCSHVRCSRALDLLDVFVRLLGEQLVEIGDDLVQEPETLDALVVRLEFHVELGEVWYRGEHYANKVALLVIQLLRNDHSNSDAGESGTLADRVSRGGISCFRTWEERISTLEELQCIDIKHFRKEVETTRVVRRVRKSSGLFVHSAQ